MYKYKVITHGGFYWDVHLYGYGDVLVDKRGNLAEMWPTALEPMLDVDDVPEIEDVSHPDYEPPAEDAAADVLEVRRIAPKQYALFNCKTGDIVVNDYVSLKRANQLAKLANTGKLDPEVDTEINHELL